MPELLTTNNINYLRTVDDYRKSSLIDLVKSIVDGDSIALDEFHGHRTVFPGPSLFIDYVNRLRENALNHKDRHLSDEVIEEAQNILTDRFSNLPPSESIGKMGDDERSQKKRLKRSHVDCRYYFRAFTKQVLAEIKDKNVQGLIEQENLACRNLKRLVDRHYKYSVLEAYRMSNPAVSRYL